MVGALERDHDLFLDLGGDAGWKLVGDGVGIAERHEEDVAARLGTVPDAVDLQHAGEPLRDPTHQLVEQDPGEAVQAA